MIVFPTLAPMRLPFRAGPAPPALTLGLLNPGPAVASGGGIRPAMVEARMSTWRGSNAPGSTTPPRKTSWRIGSPTLMDGALRSTSTRTWNARNKVCGVRFFEAVRKRWSASECVHEGGGKGEGGFICVFSWLLWHKLDHSRGREHEHEWQ